MLSLPLSPGGCAVFPGKAVLGFVERNLFLNSGLSQNPKVLETPPEVTPTFLSQSWELRAQFPILLPKIWDKAGDSPLFFSFTRGKNCI